MPHVISEKGNSREGKRKLNVEMKNDTDIFYSQIVKGDLEPQQRTPPLTAAAEAEPAADPK